MGRLETLGGLKQNTLAWSLTPKPIVCVHDCIWDSGLLAEDEGEIGFGLILVSQMFETQSSEQAHQTLVVDGELSP